MNSKNSGVLIAVGAVFLAIVLTVTTVANANRNSSGTYSLPSGNPFIPGTTISSTTMNNTMADLGAELTNSLDRSGRGGMLAALRGVDGTVASPALSFTSEPGSGLYRIGAGDLGLAVLGVKISEWTSTAFKPALTTQSINGLVSAPSYSFVNDTGSGLYRAGASDLRFAVAGADKTFWNATGFGIGVTPGKLFHVQSGGASGGTFRSDVTALLEANTGNILQFSSPNAQYSGLVFGDVSSATRGAIFFFNSASGTADQMQFQTSGTVRGMFSNSGLTIGASGTAIGNLSFGTCTLNGASPSTCTVTVTSGTTCMCSPQITGTFTGAACSVTATTATCTSGNAFTNTALVIAVK